MLRHALAAMAGLALVCGDAAAQTWSDPAGRVTFTPPAGWRTTQERSDTFTYVVSGNPNNECHVVGSPNAATTDATVDAIRRAGADDTRFSADLWVRVANSVGSLFPNNSAGFLSRSVETDGFWPIQRADLQAPDRVVHASLQLRPGLDIMTFCTTYNGPDRIAVYDNVIRSVAHPNDATYRAEGERQEAERLAAEAARTAAAAAPPEESRRRRN